MSARKVDDRWDDYCVAAAKALLLNEAARMTRTAATYKTSPSDITSLSIGVSRILSLLGSVDGCWSEAGFGNFLTHWLGFTAKEAASAVDRVRCDARKLRGQLDLFTDPDKSEATVRVADEFIREQLTDAAGKLVLANVRNEMIDYFAVLSEVPKVYCHVTGNKISKPNTEAAEVIAVADDRVNDLIQEHIANMTVDSLRELIAEKEAASCDK